MQKDKKTVTAEETFSSLKKTIKSKFISEEKIPESERSKEPEPVASIEEVDNRPLYFQLKENRQKNEEAFEEMFKLSSRIKKIDPEEYEFYQNLEKKELDREKEIKQKEQEGIRLFKLQQQRKLLIENQDQPIESEAGPAKVAAVPEVLKKKKDIQKDILGNGIVLKKRGANHNPSGSNECPKKSKTEAPKPAAEKKATLLVDYGSDSD